MKLSKKEKLFIDHSVKALQEDVCTRFRDVKCKKEKSMIGKAMVYSEEIAMGAFVLFLFFMTLENINTTNAMESKAKSNNRSPAVVHMYMAK